MPPEAPGSETGSDLPSESNGARRHLLLVDDEPVILQILASVFEDEPYRVTTVGSGADALRVIQEQGCDLLITDKNLPDINGLELLKAAKARNAFTEVIIITGYASLETALKALELGAFDYVLKPLDNVFDIQKKVRHALARQEMARENRRLLRDLQVQNRELERALEETRELQAELIQSEKLAGIGTLAAGVAHEISSPLFGIMGLAEAVEDEDDLEVVRAYARDVVEYTRNIRDIVVELSSYSRASQTVHSESVDLSRAVEDARLLVERSADVTGVRFEIDVPAGLMVNAHANELQQVFVNLIKNAAEAVRERHGAEGAGCVQVHAVSEGAEIACSVSDNGVGIPTEKLPIVFDPFYTTKPPGKGTGLGLNVVYRILTKYRGSIVVESVEGDGTTFRLRLPSPGE